MDVGEVELVELYRDFRHDRWRWSVRDSVGISCGWFADVSCRAEFDVARLAFDRMFLEVWKQTSTFPWVEEPANWWSAAPSPVT
jgi:hypothetical protein